MLHVEEAEASNYQYHSLDTVVKRITTISGSSRAMYKTTEDKRHWAIVGMNTTKSDLYGMIRGDEALRSRLVILDFKPKTPDVDWSDVVRKFIGNPDFGYSLKRYLTDDYVIPKDFSTNRYYGADKDEFMRRALSENRTTLDDWFEALEEQHQDHCGLLRTTTFNGVAHVYMSLNDIYADYEKSVKNGVKFGKAKVLKYLTDKGFVEINTRISGRGLRIYRMETTRWQAIVEQICGGVPFEEADGESCV
jgi:hypothetical protein